SNVAAPGTDVKKKSIRATEQDRADVQQARHEWPQTVSAQRPKRLIFLDETWFTTAMTPLYGYGPCGQRVVDTAPYGHWKITTFVGGLTTHGLITPMVLDGAMDAASFIAYIRQGFA